MLKAILFSALFFSGCSFFIAKIDTPLVDESNYLSNIPKVSAHCPVDQKVNMQIIGSDGNSQQVYLSMAENHRKRLDLLDHMALWSLVQMVIRPDQSSPTARFQILLQDKGETHYFDFLSEGPEEQYPYLYGIEWILKKYKKKEKLEYYAAILDRSLGHKLKIGKDFENFLIKNKDFIKKDKQLAPFFFRGTDVLKEDESSPSLNFAEVVRHYRKAEKGQKVLANNSLVEFVSDKGGSGKCNYDFNLYDNSIFLIDKFIPVANLFGLSFSGGSFMVSSSQMLEKAFSINGFPLFKGESKVRSAAVCVMEINGSKIWTFSNQSRDPGQHLFHLMRYGLPRATSVEEVDKLMRHSRHLFLSDPTRLIIESNRSRPAQIQSLLKMNLPIYNAPRLGNVWAFTLFKDQARFILDDRNPGTFICK